MYSMESARCKMTTDYIIMTALFAIGLSACASPAATNTFTTNRPSKTPTPQETSQAFRLGVPVESESQALIAGEAALRGSFDYAEPLTVVKVEQTTYGDYSKRVGTGSDRPPDMTIWLVIYLDTRFQSIAPRPGVTPFPPFHGCVSVVVNAADGLPIETGGPLPVGEVAGCDN
jgi:hypothetical protein